MPEEFAIGLTGKQLILLVNKFQEVKFISGVLNLVEDDPTKLAPDPLRESPCRFLVLKTISSVEILSVEIVEWRSTSETLCCYQPNNF